MGRHCKTTEFHSGGQDAAALDLWRCGAWNRNDIFPDLDEYEPEFLVEDCGRDVWPAPYAKYMARPPESHVGYACPHNPSK
jgi:hypothetical protein